MVRWRVWSPSLVAAPRHPLLINTVGSSDVAVAGMGDQLSGVIGALLAAGLAPREAAATGLFYSGRAADIAARGRALSPRDVTDHLAAVTGRPVSYFAVSSYAAMSEAMRAGRLHVAGFNTGSVPLAVNCGGFVPMTMMARQDGTFGGRIHR